MYSSGVSRMTTDVANVVSSLEIRYWQPSRSAAARMRPSSLSGSSDESASSQTWRSKPTRRKASRNREIQALRVSSLKSLRVMK